VASDREDEGPEAPVDFDGREAGLKADPARTPHDPGEVPQDLTPDELGATLVDREPGPSPRRLRLGALIEVVACSGFPTQIAIASLLALAGVHPFDAKGRLSASYVFVLSVADAVALVGLVTWFLHLHGERVRDVLLGQRPVLREGLVGLLQLPVLLLLIVVVMTGVQRVAPWLHNVATNPMGGLIASRLDAWLFAAVAVVGGGIREEVQRAFILHRFAQHLGGAWLGLVLFSLVFGAGHLIQGRDVATATAVLGVFWGAVYLRRRSIASTVVSHSCFNTMEILRFAIYGS
jgi:membrane protease YdiL (CAAX protease family)